MKHYPHQQHVYLAGPIEGLTYEQANNWRDTSSTFLEGCDIDVLNPCRRVSFVDSLVRDADARIWKCDLQDISYSSVILVNLSDSLPGRKWGTVAEVAHAHTKNKIIIVLQDKGQFHHPFITQYATEIHYDLHSALEAVREYFL
jgi:nucleoside 2-deoxyribosyltransferase